jgi:hypothetical protein
MKTVEMRNNGRFISHHGNGVDVYYDSRHRIIKSRVAGGCLATLVMEQTPEGGWRAQMLETCDRDGRHTVIEYRRHLPCKQSAIPSSTTARVGTSM